MKPNFHTIKYKCTHCGNAVPCIISIKVDGTTISPPRIGCIYGIGDYEWKLIEKSVRRK